MPNLGYSSDGKSIYEKNPHPLAYNRSISVMKHHTSTHTNTIQEEESHDTSTIGSTEGSEDMLLSSSVHRRRRSTSFDVNVPVPRIKLRPRYTGMTGISSSEFRSHIANSLYDQSQAGQGDENSAASNRVRRKVEPTHLRAHTFSCFDSSSLFDDVDTTGTDNIVDFGGRGVWTGSTSIPFTPQVKMSPTNSNEVVKRTGLLNASLHSFGSTFSSSNNSAFEPSKNLPTKSHTDESSSYSDSDNLNGFRFMDGKGEPKETVEEDTQMVSMHCMMEGMDVRQNPNVSTIMPATTRPRSSSRSSSPATSTTEYTAQYPNRHRRSS